MTGEPDATARLAAPPRNVGAANPAGTPGRHSWAAARAAAWRAVRRPPAPRAVPLRQALHHTLAAPLRALTDLPAFDTAAMDGWAVAGPGPWRLRTVHAAQGVLAGDTPTPLATGQAVPIATGARVPAGTTAVLRREHGRVVEPPVGQSLEQSAEPPVEQPAEPSDGTPRLHATHPRPLAPGTDIRPRGQECRAGDVLLPAVTPVTPAVLGLAAAAGHDTLTVLPRPRVTVLVLGAELLSSGVPRDGRVRDALGPMLGPWLTAWGAHLAASRRLDDDAEALYQAIRQAAATGEVDLVVTTGGTAAGPADHLHGVLRRLGGRLLVDGVAVRPGHPMLLAELPDGPLLVGLPGNPLAAVAGLFTLVEPVLTALRSPRAAPAAPAALPRGRLCEAVPGHPRDTRLVPVATTAPGGPSAPPTPGPAPVRPLPFAGPAMLRGVAAADALAVVPPGGAAAQAEVELLTPPWT